MKMGHGYLLGTNVPSQVVPLAMKCLGLTGDADLFASLVKSCLFHMEVSRDGW